MDCNCNILESRSETRPSVQRWKEAVNQDEELCAVCHGYMQL